MRTAIGQASGCATNAVQLPFLRTCHCPKCPGAEIERWLETERSPLPPVPYYLVTFTRRIEFNRALCRGFARQEALGCYAVGFLFHCLTQIASRDHSD